jgi:hypothetical protein
MPPFRFSDIWWDARVLRRLDALAALGDVTTVGYGERLILWAALRSKVTLLQAHMS